MMRKIEFNAFATFVRLFFNKFALITLLLVCFGCATTTRQPMIIKHDRASLPAKESIVGAHNKREIPEKRHPEENGSQQPVKEPADRQVRKDFSDDTIVALIELLREKNVLSADEAASIIDRTTRQTGAKKEPEIASATVLPERAEPTARIDHAESRQVLTEQVRSQQESIRAIMKEEIASAMPEWVKRIRFGGDIRLRYEQDRYDKDNAFFAKPSDPTELMNTRNDQDKFRYRVRFGVEAKVSEDLSAVIRLSTGNTANPVSTNRILGDYMNKDNILFDLAYLMWQPREFLTISGGRIPNPWFTPSRLVWDDDLNFEGLALNIQQPIGESWNSFLTVGAFPLDDYEFSSRDKWLTAGQIGFERRSSKGIAAKIGAAYYHFSNVTGIRNDPLRPGETDWTAPQFQQKGNTLFNISADPAVIKTALASEFKELNVGGTIDIGFWDPYHIILAGDYVKNLGFDKSDVEKRTGNPDPEKDTTGYHIGLTVGHPAMEKFGNWKAALAYKSIGADAVMDAFTDSDFHLGGTNAKGWYLGTDFALRKNVWLALRWITANEISGPPLAIDVLFFDLNARF
jgi:hypothetical protein